ncbi:MAG: glycosyltransferase [Armatimonadota bacterium]
MPRVLYLTETTGQGGAEAAMARLMCGLRGTELTPVLGSVGDGWLAQAAREAGAAIVSLDGIGSCDGRDPSVPLRLAALIRREQIGLVHCFLFQMNARGALAGRLAGVPVIASLRSVHYDFARWYRRVAWMVTARLATAVTAVSEDAADLLARQARIPRSRIVVIPNGVDTEQCRPGAKAGLLPALGMPDDALVVGTVGRVEPIKGHRHLIAAAGEVAKEHPRCHFVIVGRNDNEEGEALRSQLPDLGLNGRVHFLGPRDDVPALLREMDIFVLPSLSEGMSNALLEAMATGLPCIATAVGGNREVIEDGVSGVLVPPANRDALTAAILRLVGDAGMQERLGKAARERARTRYSLDAMIEAHLRLYERLAAGKGSRSAAPETIAGSGQSGHR